MHIVLQPAGGGAWPDTSGGQPAWPADQLAGVAVAGVAVAGVAAAAWPGIYSQPGFCQQRGTINLPASILGGGGRGSSCQIAPHLHVLCCFGLACPLSIKADFLLAFIWLPLCVIFSVLPFWV